VPINVAPPPGLFNIRVGKPETAKEVYQKALADERISRGSKTNFEAKLRAFNSANKTIASVNQKTEK
jgi:hypothetical protein